MLYGYPLENWLGVAEWFALMIVLGVFVFCVSTYLSNWMLKEGVNNNKLYKIKKIKNKKKQWFYEVA